MKQFQLNLVNGCFVLCGIFIMSELSKFINLLIEFEEKIEVHLNKKYKSFLRSVLNLDTLAKNIKPDRIVLSRELIVFKLGLEAKSPKAVEISLSYLLKCFQLKFIDVSMPNPCDHFIIEQTGVREVGVVAGQGGAEGVARTEVRHLLIELIRKNLVYKNSEISQLILKVLEFLISEPILGILLQMAVQHPQEAAHQVLYNFFSFRFYVYQEICYYTERQLNSFSTLTTRSQRTDKEIKAAQDEQKLLVDLIGRYMNEYLSIVEREGGRYGNCVMCSQPADHFCKITRASLCGLDCKKKHIEMAQHQYKHYFQAVNLWETIHSSFLELLIFLENHESPLVLGVLAKLLDKPHLFMVAKMNFRSLLAKHAPLIMSRVLAYKSQAAFQSIYQLAVSLAKHWLQECLSTVEYFFREYVLKVLEEKKPSLRFLNLICKALARVFQHGKVTVQLYINFDCEVNRENIVERVLFEVARILQDRFGHGSHLAKQDRLTVKNNFLSLLIIVGMGLNEYRRQEPSIVETLEIVALKQKKMSLEQFALKFNQHWTSGLKTLFNLNLVGLDSNEEIVDILMNLKGLSKDIIDELFFCEKGAELFRIFANKIKTAHPNNILMALLQLHHYIPLKINSIGVRKFLQLYFTSEEKEQQPRSKETEAVRWMEFLSRNFTQDEFLKEVANRGLEMTKHVVERAYAYALETKSGVTVGNNKAYFTYCCSRSYLDVIANQVALLQIPLSYMLETDYEVDRILALVEELVQICAHSNWLSLLIKNSAIAKYPTAEFDQIKLKIVNGVLDIIQKHAYFIQDWSTIINFLAYLYNTVQKVKALPDSKVILEEDIPVAKIERCILEASAKSDPHFNKLLLAMLIVGRDQLEKDNMFMIQKFFESIDRNLKAFLAIAEGFLPYLANFVRNLSNSSVEAAISIADMLKQSFAKLLKLPKSGTSWGENCQPEFWKLFQSLCNHKSQEVNDFVVNCVSMSVLHHYTLSYKSWIILFGFMKRRVADYRPQFYTILEKIVSCKLKGCEEFYNDLISLCLSLIHPTETKISIESLHLLKDAFQIFMGIKNSQRENSSQDDETGGEDADRKEVKEVLRKILIKLIEYLYYECHEHIIELFFRLVRSKFNGEAILVHEEVHEIITLLFLKIQSFDKSTLQVAEKTLSYGLNWSVAKYPEIVQHLQNLVIDKYNSLSYSAVRCLKTYIQITNPKTEAQWQPIEQALLKILQNTHLSDLVSLKIHNGFQDSGSQIELRDEEVRVDIGLFANKLTVQKSVIDILPSHQTCIHELLILHDQVIKFNDNLYLRVLLWRRGLGINDADRPPNLLTLEAALTNKIVNTYQSLSHTNQLFHFAYSIFKRYCHVSHQLNKTEETWAAAGKLEGKENENLGLYTDYLAQRKKPLLNIMKYFLPKLKKICKEHDQKKTMILILVESCKYVQEREGVLRAIKELATKQN